MSLKSGVLSLMILFVSSVTVSTTHAKESKKIGGLSHQKLAQNSSYWGFVEKRSLTSNKTMKRKSRSMNKTKMESDRKQSSKKSGALIPMSDLLMEKATGKHKSKKK